MKIAILGTGTVGQALATKFSQLGHAVYIGTRNVKHTLTQTQKDAFGNPPIAFWLKHNPAARLVPFKEAVAEGSDLIVFAVNGVNALDVLATIGEELLAQKVMIDITNPLDFSRGFPPSLFVSNTSSLGEQIQAAYPGLKVVKALNTMSNPVMVNPKVLAGDHSVFMSGNHEDAKAKVAQVLESFGWEKKNILDLGDITTARGTEMILPLWVRLFGKLQTPFFNFQINTDHQK